MATATSTITPEQAQSNWLAERRTFIGGSEAYQLLNIPQYGKGCARALGFEKTGKEPDYPSDMDVDLLERGNELEEIVAAKYERETGRKVRRTPRDEFGLPKVRRHPLNEHVGVHTDRTILTGTADVKETGDLELKTHREGPYIRLLREGVPPGHSLQVQHSLAVTGHKWGAFAVLWPDGWKMKHFDIARDEQVISTLLNAADSFWSTLGKGELPAPLADENDQRCKVCSFRLTCRGQELDQMEAARVKADKEGKAKLVQIANPQLEQMVAQRILLAAELKAGETAQDELDGKIKDILRPLVADNDGALLPDATKVYLKPQLVSYLDQKALKAKEPDLVEKFTKQREQEYFRFFEAKH